GSFPWCVEQANRDINGPIVINFDAMVVGNIDMGGSIGLQKSMTINGNGNVTVDRLATANGNFSLFIVSPTITCGIDWLTISGGKADEGGGIYNSGTLGLTNCTITGNSAGWMGGGIYNSSGATLNMFGSEVSNNHDVADGGPNPGQLSGGGIANYNGTVNIEDCLISYNSAQAGGGIYETGDHGSITISGSSEFRRNQSATGGGRILLQGTGNTLTMPGGEIDNNTAASNGGGIDSVSATLPFTSVEIDNNSATNRNGGGFFLSFASTATFNTCNFHANSAD